MHKSNLFLCSHRLPRFWTHAISEDVVPTPEAIRANPKSIVATDKERKN
jgi:hypothetical protein